MNTINHNAQTHKYHGIALAATMAVLLMYASNANAFTQTEPSLTSVYNNGTKYFHANAIDADSTATGIEATAIGSRALATGNQAIAQGHNATASATQTIAIGSNATASATAAVAIGFNASASAAHSVALGANAIADGTNLSHAAYNPTGTAQGLNPVGEVSVGSTHAQRRITNVAAGFAPTDAVNVSQLQGLSNAVASQISGLNNRVNHLDDTLSAGIASAIALQMPATQALGKTTWRLGAGYFRGQVALGLSARKTDKNGRWSISGGISTAESNVAVGAGFEWVTGKD